MNLKQVNTQESEEQNLKINYLTFKGAQVMWPPDCPDDMLEEAISWAKNFSETCKVKSQGGNDGQMGGRNEGLRETDYYTVRHR
jgi:hypothetical protein